MKIAVVTTSYANNYGALLQTYALQSFLNEELGEDAVALSYKPEWHKKSWRLFNKPKNFKSFVLQVYRLVNFADTIKRKKEMHASKDFMMKKIKYSDKSYYSTQELQACRSDYDCLICGSDQIWNVSTMPGKKPYPPFFLQFAADWYDIKKIAYAPSIADPIPEDAIPVVRAYINKLDAISVREINDVDNLQPLTNKKVHHVLDPVFLLSAEKWNTIATEPKIKEKYILCYFLSYGDFAKDAVKKLKEFTGYKIVNININAYDKLNADINICDAGPEEFLGLIKNAEFILTNSFHCTAFSTIFRKNFFIVNIGHSTSRMKTLQAVLGIEDRFISKDWLQNGTKDTLNIDYSQIKVRSKKKIAESKAYLKDALYEK